MANLLNDTDPQSPRAFSRTDPGIGDSRDAPAESHDDGADALSAGGASAGGASAAASGASLPKPVAAVAPAAATAAVPTLTPSPAASASIEALLDGITGPRPPPPSARREIGPAADRVYAAARPAPAPQPMAAPEPPLVVSPEPAPVVPVVPVEPAPDAAPVLAGGEATRPVTRRARDEPTLRQRRKEEKTVFTGRRAVIRNATVMILSASIVAVLMMSILRWREGRPPEDAAAGSAGTPAPQPEAPLGQSGQANPPPSVAASDNEPAQAASAAGAVTPAPPATGKPPPSRHSRGERTHSTQQNSLDDLNRQIRH